VLLLRAKPSNLVHGIERRFIHLRGHVKLFGFLNNIQNIQKTGIRKHTAELEALAVITIKQSRPTDADVVTKKRNHVDS